MAQSDAFRSRKLWWLVMFCPAFNSLNPYMVSPLFAARLATYAEGTRVSSYSRVNSELI